MAFARIKVVSYHAGERVPVLRHTCDGDLLGASQGRGASWKPYPDCFVVLSPGSSSANLEEYSDGKVPFVSNSNLNNGVVRYVERISDNEVITQVPCLAVNGFGFATIQTEPFIGAGNGGVHVIALIPKESMTVLELAFYAASTTLPGDSRTGGVRFGVV